MCGKFHSPLGMVQVWVVIFTSLPTKMPLHAKWHHERIILVKCLVIKNQNHTTPLLTWWFRDKSESKQARFQRFLIRLWLWAQHFGQSSPTRRMLTSINRNYFSEKKIWTRMVTDQFCGLYNVLLFGKNYNWRW